MRIDFINILPQLACRFCFYLLNFLQSSWLNKRFLGNIVHWKIFWELVKNILEDLVRAILNKRFESVEIVAHWQNIFQGLLGLFLHIFCAFVVFKQLKNQSGNVVFSHGSSMIRWVCSHMSQAPHSSCF